MHGRLRFVSTPSGESVADSTRQVASVTSGLTFQHPAQCTFAYQPALGFAGEQAVWYTTAPGGSLEKQRRLNEEDDEQRQPAPPAVGSDSADPFADETLHAVVLFVMPSLSPPVAFEDSYHLQWDGLLPALPFPKAINPQSPGQLLSAAAGNSVKAGSDNGAPVAAVSDLLRAQIEAASKGAAKKAQLPWRFLPILANDEDRDMGDFGGDETHACSRPGVKALEDLNAGDGAWLDVVVATDYVISSQDLTVDVDVTPISMSQATAAASSENSTLSAAASATMRFRSRCWYPSDLLSLRRAINDQYRLEEEEDEEDENEDERQGDEEHEEHVDSDREDEDTSGGRVDYLKSPQHESGGGGHAAECGVDGSNIASAPSGRRSLSASSRSRAGAGGVKGAAGIDRSMWRRRRLTTMQPFSEQQEGTSKGVNAAAADDAYVFSSTARSLEELLVSLPLLPNSLLSRCVARFEGLPSSSSSQHQEQRYRYDVKVNVPASSSSSFSSVPGALITHVLEDVAPSSTIVLRHGTLMSRAASAPSSSSGFSRSSNKPPSMGHLHVRRSQLTMKPCKVMSIAAVKGKSEKTASAVNGGAGASVNGWGQERDFHLSIPAPNPVTSLLPCFLVGGVLSDSDKKFLVNPATGEHRVPSLEQRPVTRAILDALCTGGSWARTNNHNPTNLYLLASDAMAPSTLFVNADSRMALDRTTLLKDGYQLVSTPTSPASVSTTLGAASSSTTVAATATADLVKVTLPKQPRRPASSPSKPASTGDASPSAVLAELDARCSSLMAASLAATGASRNLTASGVALLPWDCVRYPSRLYARLKQTGLGGQVTLAKNSNTAAPSAGSPKRLGEAGSAAGEDKEEENVVAVVNADGTLAPSSSTVEPSADAVASLHNAVARALVDSLYRHYREKLLAPELGSSFIAATCDSASPTKRKAASLSPSKVMKARERVMALLHPNANHPLATSLLSPWAKQELGKQAIDGFKTPLMHPAARMQVQQAGGEQSANASITVPSIRLKPLLMPLPGLSLDLDMDVLREASSYHAHASAGDGSDEGSDGSFVLPYVVPSYYPYAFDGSDAALRAYDALIYESARAIVEAGGLQEGQAAGSPFGGPTTALQRLYAQLATL